MANLTTQYLGLQLKNPLIVGSSGLTASADSIIKLAENGVAAVVLKSVFEEEIQMEFQETLKNQMGEMENNLEFFDYYDYKLKDDMLKRTAELISEVKSKSDIPVIASINCRSVGEWYAYAAQLQNAGADALELNLFRMPASANESAATIAEKYLKIIEKVKEYVTIPVSVKLSPYFTDLAHITTQMDKAGVDGFVFFNRFYSPDFDLKNKRVVSSKIYSNANDYAWSMRWIAILASQLNAGIAASTGVHTPETFIKMMVAGAAAVQVVSSLYINGSGYVLDLLHGLEKWMEEMKINSISEIHEWGKEMFPNNPEQFERVQFMKYFGEHK